MQTGLDRCLAAPGSSGLSCPLRPLTGQRVTSFAKKTSGKTSGPLPLPRFGKFLSTVPTDTSSRDVSCDAHCAIPWELAETSLVDPAGKDACGVST
jgi:hypothetical protein